MKDKDFVVWALLALFSTIYLGLQLNTNILLTKNQLAQVSSSSSGPSVSISVANSSIFSGESTKIYWSSTNADGCSISGGLSGHLPISGQETLRPTQTTTYTVSCSGDGKTDSKSIVVSVVSESQTNTTLNTEEPSTATTEPVQEPVQEPVTSSAPSTVLYPTLSLSANPTTIPLGNSATITWHSSNALACNASGGWTGKKLLSSSVVVSPSKSTTYTLTCESGGGFVSKNITINVGASEIAQSHSESESVITQPTTLTEPSTATTQSPTEPISPTTVVQSPTPTSNFQIGNQVQTIANLNVRNSATLKEGSIIGVQPIGSLGKIIGGPIFADNHIWWNIDYVNQPDGWSSESFLVKTSFTITPTPTTTTTTSTGGANEPSGFTPIAVRPFNCKATSATQLCNEIRKPVPSAWDDAENRYPNIQWFNDLLSPASPGGIMRFLYPAQTVASASTYNPGVVQTLSLQSLQKTQLYGKYTIKLSNNFYGHPTNTNKLVFHRGNDVSNGKRFEPILRVRGSGTGPLNISVDCQGCVDNEIPIPNGPAVSRGVWHTVEVLMQLNTPGNKNGVIKVWLDGTLAINETSREITSGQGYWDSIHIAPTWGGQGGVIPQDFWWDLDDLYVSGGANNISSTPTPTTATSPTVTTQSAAGCEASGASKCYYIDPVLGNDSNNGASPTTAWKTFKNISTYYTTTYKPAGWVQAGAGDYIYLMDGIHNTELKSGDGSGPNGGTGQKLYFRTIKNPASNPITIKEYPGANAIVGDSGGAGFFFLQSSGFVIKDIEFRNNGGHGIWAASTDEILIDNIYLHDNSRGVQPCCNPAGIKINTAKNVVISNSVFHDNFEGAAEFFPRGIALQIFGGADGGNIQVYGNTFYQTKNVFDANGQSFGTADCFLYKHASNDPASWVEIRNNVFRNCRISYFGGQQNTYFHHNVIENSRQDAIRFFDPGGTTHLVNERVEFNTIYNSGSLGFMPAPLYWISPSFPSVNKNISYKNNIIYRKGDQMINFGQYMTDAEYTAVVPEIKFENNCYFSPNGQPTFGFGSANGGTRGVLGSIFSLAQWRSSPFFNDINSVVADPLFVNAGAGDFRLQPGSPCSAMGAL